MFVIDEKFSVSISAIKCLNNDFSIYNVRLAGEWIVVNCSVNTNDNVALWYGNDQLSTDQKRVTMVSKNVYNLTNLTEARAKKTYTCRVCGRNVCGNKAVGILFLEGKAGYFST